MAARCISHAKPCTIPQRFGVSDLPPDPLLDQQVLRLHAESVQINRRTIDTGTVEVAVVTRFRDQLIDETLSSTTAHVEHVPVGRIVDEMPQVREEGDLMIVPIVEEIVVTRLFLREELHITRTTTTRRHQDTVSLRSEEAVVTRSNRDAQPSAPNFDQHSATIEDMNHGQ